MTESARIRRSGNSMDYCFTDFNRGSWQETCGGKICSTAPVTTAEGISCCSCTRLTFLVKHRITQVCQPPYSPDLAPCDFWLFSKLKLPLKGRRFQTANEIKMNATRQLTVIPKKEFLDCFEKWKECWDKCVRSQGEYFEGD